MQLGGTWEQWELVGAIEYSLGSAMRGSSASPYTNGPTRCTVEGCEHVHWSYLLNDQYEVGGYHSHTVVSHAQMGQ